MRLIPPPIAEWESPSNQPAAGHAARTMPGGGRRREGRAGLASSTLGLGCFTLRSDSQLQVVEAPYMDTLLNSAVY